MSRDKYNGDCPVCGERAFEFERVHTGRSYKGGEVPLCIRPAEGYDAFEVYYHA